MKRIVTVALVSICAPMIAVAQSDPKPLANFTSDCKEQDATGFRWDGSRWVRAEFPKLSYSVRKLQGPKSGREADGTLNFCSDLVRKPDGQAGTDAWISACYRIAAPDEAQPIAGWCREYQEKVGDSWRLSYVACKRTAEFWADFTFLPDGTFTRSTAHDDLAPLSQHAAMRDLKISHGTCSIIQ